MRPALFLGDEGVKVSELKENQEVFLLEKEKAFF